MQLSVIIPVYRVEHTLRRCVDSILAQCPDNTEVILVDDGSPDSSPQICDDYARADKRVKVIHRTNGGLGSARNSGIDTATGDYLMFADSDDFLADGTIRNLIETVKKHPEYDFVEFPVYEWYGDPKRQYRLTFTDEVFTDMDDYWLRCRAYRHTYAWNKIYRSGIFKALRFAENTKFEDAHTLPSILSCCQTVATTPEGLYYYCSNPTGITSTADGEALSQLLEAHVPQFLKLESRYGHKDNNTHWLLEEYYACLLNIQLDVFRMTGKAPTLPQRHYTSTIKLLSSTLLGIKTLCTLNKFTNKILKLH